jgi:beta-lactamase class A
MEKARLVIIAETIIILILTSFLIWNIYSSRASSVTGKIAYCEKYMYEDKTCLLSSRVYTGLLPSENFLILNFKPLQNDIQGYISQNNLNISVYVLNIRDSASFGINSNTGFEPASLNKLPVAMLILKKVEQGELSLDTVFPINEEDRDSKSGPLYNQKIYSMNVSSLLYYMLSESDNTAFRVLESQVSLEDLQKLSVYLNYYTKDINYISPVNNTYQITPKSTGNLFMSLYLSTVLKPEDSEMILSLLTNTTGDEFDLQKYSNLPKNITIAEKYGSYYLDNESFFHDCGIMYLQDSRIFYCIMTRNLDKEKASNVIGNIVNKIYNYVTESKINNINI